MEKSEIWREYYRKTRDRPPRATLLRALDLFDEEGLPERPFAIDLGAGIGRDTGEMLRRGWRVLAIDAEQSAIDGLLSRDDLPAAAKDRLETRVIRFEDADLPRCHLVNASFSLQGCPAEQFDSFWSGIVRALHSGGRFCGQILGPRDSWADPARGKPGISAFPRSRVERFLRPFEPEWFEEIEEDAVTPRGEAKHWHYFQIVARKR